MKPYKIKHVPSGLYYQPKRYGGSNLSALGKIYQTKSNILTLGFYSNGDPRETLTIYANKNTGIYKKFKDVFNWRDSSGYNEAAYDTSVGAWVTEEIK